MKQQSLKKNYSQNEVTSLQVVKKQSIYLYGNLGIRRVMNIGK